MREQADAIMSGAYSKPGMGGVGAGDSSDEAPTGGKVRKIHDKRKQTSKKDQQKQEELRKAQEQAKIDALKKKKGKEDEVIDEAQRKKELIQKQFKDKDTNQIA